MFGYVAKLLSTMQYVKDYLKDFDSCINSQLRKQLKTLRRRNER